jgi:hypothetical protein
MNLRRTILPMYGIVIYRILVLKYCHSFVAALFKVWHHTAIAGNLCNKVHIHSTGSSVCREAMVYSSS